MLQLGLERLQVPVERGVRALEDALGVGAAARPRPGLVLAALEQNQPLVIPVGVPALDVAAAQDLVQYGLAAGVLGNEPVPSSLVDEKGVGQSRLNTEEDRVWSNLRDRCMTAAELIQQSGHIRRLGRPTRVAQQRGWHTIAVLRDKRLELETGERSPRDRAV